MKISRKIVQAFAVVACLSGLGALLAVAAPEKLKAPIAAASAAKAGEINRAAVEAKLAELTIERDKFVKDAERQAAAYEGALAGLRALLDPPKKPEATAAKPAPAPSPVAAAVPPKGK